MKTLEIRVSDIIHVFDVVPRIVSFVVRVVQQIYQEVIVFIKTCYIQLRQGRAPPVGKKVTKKKGDSR